MASNPATYSSHSSDAFNHLNTDIESGNFNEKASHNDTASKTPHAEEEEDEDMDALIDELESQDGHQEEEEMADDSITPAVGRNVPEDLLNTSLQTGLTEQEVTARRKKFGLNQMKEEKENLLLKFLGYFIGPIQFVMEVSSPTSQHSHHLHRVTVIYQAYKDHIIFQCSLFYCITKTIVHEAHVLIIYFSIGCSCSCCRSRRLG